MILRWNDCRLGENHHHRHWHLNIKCIIQFPPQGSNNMLSVQSENFSSWSLLEDDWHPVEASAPGSRAKWGGGTLSGMKLKFPATVNNCIKTSPDIPDKWLASKYPWCWKIEISPIMTCLRVAMWHSQSGDWTSIRPTISLNRDLTDWRYLLISFSTDHSYYLTLSRQLSDGRFIWEFIKFFLQDYCLPSNKEQIFEFPANSSLLTFTNKMWNCSKAKL